MDTQPQSPSEPTLSLKIRLVGKAAADAGGRTTLVTAPGSVFSGVSLFITMSRVLFVALQSVGLSTPGSGAMQTLLSASVLLEEFLFDIVILVSSF